MKNLFKTPYLLILIFCALALHGIAQKPTFSWGEEQKCYNIPKIFQSNDEYYYYLQFNGKHRNIMQFNTSNNKLVSKFEMNLKYGGKEIGLIENILFADNKIYIIGQYINYKSHKLTIYKKSFDQDLKNESDWEELEEISDLYSVRDCKLSEDRSKIALIIQKTRVNSDDFPLLQYLIYDNKFKKIFSNQIDFKGEDYYTKIRKSDISDDGTFTLLLSNTIKKGLSIRSISHTLFVSDIKNNKTQEFPIQSKNKLITTASYYTDNATNNLIIAGFQLEPISKEEIVYGMFFQNFNLNSRRIDNENVQNFSEDFFPTYNKKFSLTDNIDWKAIRHMVKKENGSFAIICEDVNGIDSDQIFGELAYGGILYINIKSDLSVIRNILLEKLQFGLSNIWQYISFSFFESKNNSHIIFYDHKKSDRTITIYKGGNIDSNIRLMHYTIDEKGEIQKEYLSDGGNNEKLENYYVPTYSFPIKNKLIVIGAKTLKKFKFGTLTFN